MTAELVRELVPFGIIGLAIVALVIIVLNPQRAPNQRVSFLVILAIVAMAIFDRIMKPGQLERATSKAPEISTPSGASGGMFWVDSGTNADWGGRDWAFTAGLTPKYAVKGTRLCDESHSGWIATCWENRPTGYPANVNLTDVVGTPAQWCTYKDSSISLSVPPDGRAQKGRVYLCARSIAHTP